MNATAITTTNITPLPVRSPSVSRERLALSAVEQAAVTRLVAGDSSVVVGRVSERAAALASDEDCRRRSIAKALAVAEAQLAQLSAALVDAVARRDERAVQMIDRVVTSATKRVTMLSDELRTDFAGGRRHSVLIAANEVSLGR